MMHNLARLLHSPWLIPPTLILLLLLLAYDDERVVSSDLISQAVGETVPGMNLRLRNPQDNAQNDLALDGDAGVIFDDDGNGGDGSNANVETEEQNQDQRGINVLLFVTAHVNPKQLDFFRSCWPIAMEQANVVRTADILVYAATDGDSLLEEQFASTLTADDGAVFPKDQNVTLKLFSNPGYQEGAIMAMSNAIENGWFSSYDWIVRLNPDVLIRDDDFLLRSLRNDSIDGIFSQCPRPRQGGLYPIHTDFFAVRPRAIPDKSFQYPHGLPPGTIGTSFTAELQAQAEFKNIVESNRHVWLPGVRHEGIACRMVGNDSPVIHDHGLLDKCRNEHSISGGSHGDTTILKQMSPEELKVVSEQMCKAQPGFKGSMSIKGLKYNIDCSNR